MTNARIGRLNFENRFTGRAVADLLLGLPSQFALTSLTVMDQGQDMQFYFVQDDYRVTPRLTVNAGVRYEYATPPRERHNQFANFDPVSGTMIFARDGSIYERALIHPDRNNVAPRLGFAYTPASRWVVRGGYAQFRTELFNAFNHANFGPPNMARDSSGFGQIVTAGPARIVQLGLKLYF